jgi:hypothetical protein
MSNPFPKQPNDKAHRDCNICPCEKLIKIILDKLKEEEELQNTFKEVFEECSIEEILDANIYDTDIILSVLKKSLNGGKPLSELYTNWTSKKIPYIDFKKEYIEIKGGNKGDLKIKESIFLYTLEDLSEYIYLKIDKNAEFKEKFVVFNDDLEQFKTGKKNAFQQRQQIKQHKMEQNKEYQLQKSKKELEERDKEIAQLKNEKDSIIAKWKHEVNSLKMSHQQQLKDKSDSINDKSYIILMLQEKIKSMESEARQKLEIEELLTSDI